MTTSNTWPKALWLIRHGQSAGNVARDAANSAGAQRIDIGARDVDVPLSALGERQSSALGDWFATLSFDERPDCVLCSPYLRALQTAQRLQSSLEKLGRSIALTLDERLREKEFGILDRLTTVGIRALFPEQAELRAAIGKFYHRPPGGESWCDVILRLRSLLDTLSIHYADKRVVIVTHQVAILCLRYLLEDMNEAQILGIDAEGDIANCGVTRYEALGGGTEQKMALRLYNWTAPLEQTATTVTRKADTPAGAK